MKINLDGDADEALLTLLDEHGHELDIIIEGDELRVFQAALWAFIRDQLDLPVIPNSVFTPPEYVAAN